jgi:drug/metabolite transporter (DMT)-like permease
VTVGWPGKRLVLGEPVPRGEGTSTLGIALAILTAMVAAVGFIAAKPVLEYLDPLSFSLTQFGLASAFSFAWLLARRRVGGLALVTHGQWTFLVVVALLFLAAVAGIRESPIHMV